MKHLLLMLQELKREILKSLPLGFYKQELTWQLKFSINSE